MTAHDLVMTMIREVLYTTGITATAGIGTNLYLAKLAMDITAKHAAPDKDGVRIAELDEESFRYLLWDHKPLTDFWMTGPGTVKRLEKHGIHTMGELAYFSTVNQFLFCKVFFDIVILNRGLTIFDHVHLLRDDIHSSHLMVLAQQSCNGQANVAP